MVCGEYFDWDEHNEGHIAAHNVTRAEVEQVFRNNPTHTGTRVDARSGEERVLEIGHTDADRVLYVAWTARGERRRPVTAWDANRKDRAEYKRNRR